MTQGYIYNAQSKVVYVDDEIKEDEDAEQVEDTPTASQASSFASSSIFGSQLSQVSTQITPTQELWNELSQEIKAASQAGLLPKRRVEMSFREEYPVSDESGEWQNPQGRKEDSRREQLEQDKSHREQWKDEGDSLWNLLKSDDSDGGTD